MSARCFQYDPTEASSFGDCCDTLGVVPKPWWWYLVLTLPVELALAFFRETEGGSIGERKTARENVVFSVVTLLALTPIVARLVAPLFDDSYEKVCDGGWNCYEAFVFTFSNSSALLTCLTLWVRLKFKRFFPAMVRAARLWLANPAFSFDLSDSELMAFHLLHMAQIMALRAEDALFSSFSNEQIMDAESREGTSMALEHYFALLVICAGGALTHVVPAAAAYVWVFGPLLLALLVSHALRVGPLRNYTAIWLISNIPLVVVGLALHVVLTVLVPAVALFVAVLYILALLIIWLVYALFRAIGLVFYRIPIVLTYAVARYRFRGKEPRDICSQIQDGASLADKVEAALYDMPRIVGPMRQSINEELERILELERAAIEAEPESAFASPEARAELIKERWRSVKNFARKVADLEAKMLRPVDRSRITSNSALSDPFKSRIWFMLTALFFNHEFSRLREDLARTRWELQRARGHVVDDRLEYIEELREQLAVLTSMPQPFLDFGSELHDIVEEWEEERERRLQQGEGEGEGEEDEGEEDAVLDEDKGGRAPRAVFFGQRLVRSPGEKKMKSSKAAASEAAVAPPPPPAAAPTPTPTPSARRQQFADLEQSIVRQWDSGRKLNLSAAGLADFSFSDQSVPERSAGFGVGSSGHAEDLDDLDMAAAEVFKEESREEQSAKSRALDTLKQLLRQLKRLVLFDALGDLVVFGTAFTLLVFSMAANYGLLLYSGAPYIEVPWIEAQARDSRRLIDCYSFSTDISLDLSALGIIELLITAFGFLMSLIFGARFIVLFVSDPGLFWAGAEQLQAATAAV